MMNGCVPSVSEIFRLIKDLFESNVLMPRSFLICMIGGCSANKFCLLYPLAILSGRCYAWSPLDVRSYRSIYPLNTFDQKAASLDYSKAHKFLPESEWNRLVIEDSPSSLVSRRRAYQANVSDRGIWKSKSEVNPTT